jgi:hypothetical protein
LLQIKLVIIIATICGAAWQAFPHTFRQTDPSGRYPGGEGQGVPKGTQVPGTEPGFKSRNRLGVAESFLALKAFLRTLAAEAEK